MYTVYRLPCGDSSVSLFSLKCSYIFEISDIGIYVEKEDDGLFLSTDAVDVETTLPTLRDFLLSSRLVFFIVMTTSSLFGMFKNEEHDE